MKIKHLLTTSLIALLALTGCASKSTKIPSQPIQANDNIIENSYVKPDYSITEIDGKCYMNFSDGNLNNDSNNVNNYATHMLSSIKFNSLKDMKHAIENNTFEESQIYTIKQIFNQGNKNGIEIINTNKLYQPVLHANFEITDYLWHGKSYGCMLNLNDTWSRSFKYLTKEDYDSIFKEDYEDWLQNENIISVSSENKIINGINAVEYHFNTSTTSLKSIRYCIKTASKALYVNEKYVLSSSNEDSICSETIPVYVTVYGCEDNNYFSYLFYGLNEPLSIDWISSLGIEPYID